MSRSSSENRSYSPRRPISPPRPSGSRPRSRRSSPPTRRCRGRTSPPYARAVGAGLVEARRLFDDGRYAAAAAAASSSLPTADGDLSDLLDLLSEIERRRGDLSAAERHGRDAVARRESRARESGTAESETRRARSWNQLARVLEARGQFADAAQLFERALRSRESVLGAEHPETIESVNDLAWLRVE